MSGWPQPKRQDKGTCICCRERDWTIRSPTGERWCERCYVGVRRVVERQLGLCPEGRYVDEPRGVRAIHAC